MSHPVSDQAAAAVPDPVAPIAGAMASYPAAWALCGGWAIDAWLGRGTRDHGDVDVCTFAQDLPALFDHLSDWQLVAHDPNLGGATTDMWDGRALDLPAHLHGRRDRGEPLPPGGKGLMPEDGFILDVQINDRDGADWVLSRDPLVSIPLAQAIRRSPWGVPMVVPEVLLFYKSRDLRRRDKLDFATLLPHLTTDQRAWLRDTIALLGHPWLAELTA